MGDFVDIAIVGAGPAGARAAELLALRRANVALLDPDAPWEKPCGGGLTPPLFAELPELEEVKAFARPIGRARVELRGGPALDVRLADALWIVSREALGRWQLERASRAGARHVQVRVRHLERTRDGWFLETDGGPFRAGYAIGADGAASTVRRCAAPALRVEEAPTRVTYPRDAPPHPDEVVLRFFDGAAGYLWDFARPDHRSVGIEVTSGGWRRAELDASIDEYRAREGAVAEPPRAGAVIGTAQLGHGDFSGIAGERFALLGDAAGLADPFTGEGIRNALRSAALLARAWDLGRHDWTMTYAALARRAFAHELALSRLLRRTLSESGLGVRLLARAEGSPAAHALVATVLNTVAVHDYRPSRLLSLWREARRRASEEGPRSPATPRLRARPRGASTSPALPPRRAS